MSMMLSDAEFRTLVDAALESLTKHLYATEEDGEFEVEVQGGVLNIVFEEPAGKFVVTANAPVQQIWISALSTSFKLDWSPEDGAFVLGKTGEKLMELVDRVIQEHLNT
jgi:iron donor protein CyaY